MKSPTKKSLGLTIAIAVLTPVACSMLLGCTCLQNFLRPSKQPASIDVVEKEPPVRTGASR